MGRLQDKIALISGAASGIGAYTAKIFAAQDAHVIVAYDDDVGAKAVVQDITDSAASWDKAVAAGVKAFGNINVLVNNAGILIVKLIQDTTEEEWDRIFRSMPRVFFWEPKPFWTA